MFLINFGISANSAKFNQNKAKAMSEQLRTILYINMKYIPL